MSNLNIENCVKNVNNKFKLVLMASKRARNIMSKNVKLFVDPLNDKSTVVALREIEDGHSVKFIDEPKD